MRTCVVTGSASGIGAATADRLRGAGHRVVGVDLHDADVTADLSDLAGRTAMVDAIADATGGVVDAVVACAGVMAEAPIAISVNYFGAVATLDGLRPLLARSDAPRAVTVSSIASLMASDPATVEACLAGDEEAACRHIAAAPTIAYMTSKAALARWVRRTAPTPEWAGEGIPLNAIAPGTVETPMTAELLSAPGGLEMTDTAVPMPCNGHARAQDLAPLLEFLVSPDNSHVTGQVVFIDGGAEAITRGDGIW
ncbi:MAG: SDR family oxidoreductase [Acidimicrobiales bacterium]|nr:SDR family oxidoreductase [Acidimicrobiales bacterium]